MGSICLVGIVLSYLKIDYISPERERSICWKSLMKCSLFFMREVFEWPQVDKFVWPLEVYSIFVSKSRNA